MWSAGSHVLLLKLHIIFLHLLRLPSPINTISYNTAGTFLFQSGTPSF